MRVLHGPGLMGHPKATEGVVEGNPFHQQALEVARIAGAHFTLNVTMNSRREITGIFSGRLEDAHDEGVRFAERQAADFVDEPVDIAITSSAGLPLDLTYYQAVKGLTAALPIVKPGGTIIIAAQCAEGIGGPEFTELLLNTPSVAAFRERLRDPDFFVIDQWQLQELCKVLEKVEVKLYAEGIPPASSDRLLVELVPSVEEGLAAAMHRHGVGARVAVVPKGPYVLTRVREAG